MLAGSRSASVKCGGQFVMMDGTPVMQQLCADSWDFLDQVLICTVLSVKLRSLCIGPKIDMCTLVYKHLYLNVKWWFSIATLAVSRATFGQGTGPIYLDDVGCTGTESSLLSCSHRGIGVLRRCYHFEDAGVMCPPCKRFFFSVNVQISNYHNSLLELTCYFCKLHTCY